MHADILPDDFEVALVLGEQTLHAHEPHVEIDHVVVFVNFVDKIDMGCGIDIEPHREALLRFVRPESEIGGRIGHEIVVAGIDLDVIELLFDEERQVEDRSRIGKEYQRTSVVGFVVFQHDRGHPAPLIGKGDLHQVVLDFVMLFGAFGRLEQAHADVLFELCRGTARSAVHHGDGSICGRHFDRFGSGLLGSRLWFLCEFFLNRGVVPGESEEDRTDDDQSD